MNVLAEPLFVLSTIVVLVAILAPVLLLHRKEFTYVVRYDGLFEIAAEADGEDGPGEIAGEEVRVVVVELKNSSGRHIDRSHYARPITVGFGEGARILGAEVVEEAPSGIGATLRELSDHTPERVALAPVLINDGNMVLLEAVVADSEQGEIEVDGRMVGIDGISEQRRSAVQKTVLAVANGVVALAAVSFGSLYLVVFSSLEINFFVPSVLNPVAGGLAGLVIGDVLLLVGVVRRWRRSQKVQRRVLARRVAAEDGAE